MHWKNSNFQTENFIAGRCHTADEAYRVLLQQLEDRNMAIATAHRCHVRWRKWVMRDAPGLARALLRWARLVRGDALDENSVACYEEALREAAHLRELISQLEPQRKFRHLPPWEAHQAAQREEWKLELMWRAENFIASQGTIPHDHLATMRMHPDFESEIAPRVAEMLRLARTDEYLLKGKTLLLENRT